MAVAWQRAGALGAGELAPHTRGEEHLGAGQRSACPLKHPSVPTNPLARGWGEPGYDMLQEGWGIWQGASLLGGGFAASWLL